MDRHVPCKVDEIRAELSTLQKRLEDYHCDKIDLVDALLIANKITTLTQLLDKIDKK